MNELKKSIESFNNRLNQSEERISELGDRSRNYSEEKRRKGIKRSEECLQDSCDIIKRNNVCIVESQKEK